jgi:hypothetical protein
MFGKVIVETGDSFTRAESGSGMRGLDAPSPADMGSARDGRAALRRSALLFHLGWVDRIRGSSEG